MPKTVLLWHFDEPDGVHPSDAAGNLDDLRTEPSIAPPTSVETWEGRGRAFSRASSQALMAADITGRDTLLQRDVTIQALIALTLTGAAGPHTVIARGLNDGSTSERYAFGLELEEQAANPGMVEVRLFWQDSAGNVVTAPPGVFEHPGDGKETLLTATRRWERTDRVVVRYYVADELIAELETDDGDISGGTTGYMSIGARKAAGAWGRFLNGTIDELLVTDHEMSLEEVRHTWKRLTEYQPGGVETFAGLVPPGLDWAANPSNNLGRRVKITGEALGLVVAQTEQLRELFLPDRATHEQIAEWEYLCGLRPKPRDGLDTRRSRSLAFLGREEGYAPPQIQVALAELLDTQAANIEILEYSNEQRDTFESLDTDERWLAGDVGVWSIVANELHLAVAAGDVSLQAGGHAHLRMSIDVGAAPDGSPIGGSAWLAAKLSSWTLQNDTGAGIYLQNRVDGALIWLGVYKDAGGTAKIGYRLRHLGALGAFTEIAAAPGAGPLWLRLETVPDEGAPTVRCGYSTTGPGAGFTVGAIASSAGNAFVQWAGFLATSAAAGALPGAIAADFDDFVVFCPDGDRPFNWHAYRDPALLGEPDMIGAQALAHALKPSHTRAGVCESKSVLAGNDRFGLCGRGPCGGF